jgi:hypothetical protein
MPPPPGVVPNFDNPETLFPRVVTTHLVSVCLAFAFILIRLWTRYYVSRSMWWDDCECHLRRQLSSLSSLPVLAFYFSRFFLPLLMAFHSFCRARLIALVYVFPGALEADVYCLCCYRLGCLRLGEFLIRCVKQLSAFYARERDFLGAPTDLLTETHQLVSIGYIICSIKGSSSPTRLAFYIVVASIGVSS